MKPLLFILALVALAAGGQNLTLSDGAHVGASRPAAASSAFTYSAVRFDSGDFMYKAAALTGIADSKLGLFSAWIKRDASCDASAVVLQIGRARIVFANPEYSVQTKDATDTANLFAYKSGTPDTDWHHLAISWDLGTAGRRNVVLDGTESTAQVTFVDAAVDYDAAGTTHVNAVGSYGTGDNLFFTGDLCEVYFTIPAAYVDLTDSANVQKFRTTGGKPENLGADGSIPTGTQPLVYLKGDYTGFGVNSGSGGDFTVSGTITAASTTP